MPHEPDPLHCLAIKLMKRLAAVEQVVHISAQTAEEARELRVEHIQDVLQREVEAGRLLMIAEPDED